MVGQLVPVRGSSQHLHACFPAGSFKHALIEQLDLFNTIKHHNAVEGIRKLLGQFHIPYEPMVCVKNGMHNA